jgi:hypothetical protein
MIKRNRQMYVAAKVLTEVIRRCTQTELQLLLLPYTSAAGMYVCRVHQLQLRITLMAPVP